MKSKEKMKQWQKMMMNLHQKQEDKSCRLGWLRLSQVDLSHTVDLYSFYNWKEMRLRKLNNEGDDRQGGKATQSPALGNLP